MDHTEQRAGQRGRALRKWQRLLIKGCVAVLLFGFLAWLLAVPMLKGMGRFLIVTDPLRRADAICVLGGASWERPLEGARLYRDGLAPLVICTSGNVPQDIQALGLAITESELALRVVLEHGVPADHVLALRQATSTKEEADALLHHAISNGLDTLLVVSSPFHLRRIAYVFRKRFRSHGITVMLHGAPTTRFDVDHWWRYEEGLLMVNNEYVKLAYYLFKY